MSYTYSYIDGLINRTEYIITWRDIYINSTTTTTLQDVYDEMLDDLRIEYLRNGPIDWAAAPAWILKNYTIWYFHRLIVVIFEVLAVLLWLYLLITRWGKIDRWDCYSCA